MIEVALEQSQILLLIPIKLFSFDFSITNVWLVKHALFLLFFLSLSLFSIPEKIKAAVEGLGERIKAAVESLGEKIKGAIQGIRTKIAGGVRNLAVKIRDFLLNLIPQDGVDWLIIFLSLFYHFFLKCGYIQTKLYCCS